MKLTKLEHSCLLVELSGASLLIDPGELTELRSKSLPPLDAVFITHIHGDHFSLDNLKALHEFSPQVTIYGNSEVAEAATVGGIEVAVVKPGDALTVGSHTVAISGGDHAVIHKTSPCQNISVQIGDELFHPGDSLQQPDGAVRVLCVPASAPWLKTTEAMEYIAGSSSQIVLPIHDGLLSEFGHTVHYNWLQRACQESGKQWLTLAVNESREVL